MDLSQRIQAKTDNGDTIIDFLIEVMTDTPHTQNRDEGDGFKLSLRLQAARLLANYGCCHKSTGATRSPLADQAISFIVDSPREPSLRNSGPSSSDETLFDAKLAKIIQESTDDGATVCRFLINVMEGKLKAFTPQNRITAARELLSRGFGKHATPRRSGEGRNPEKAVKDGSHPSIPTTQTTESHQSPNHTNQSSDDIPYDEINALIDAAKERSDRILAEQGIDPDNPPHKPDYSAFDAAADNSHRWFHEWKDSIDPEEYQAIIKQTAERFDAKIDLRIERRKQAAAERERREKVEAERLAKQKQAESEATAEEPDEPGPPPRSKHKQKLMFTLGNSMYVDCGHPNCDLHDEDRNRWQGSVQYGAGPTSGHFP